MAKPITSKTLQVAAILRETTCGHGYANAGWCSTCYAVALDRVEETDDLAKLRKTVAALAVTVDEMAEWQAEATRFLDRVHDELEQLGHRNVAIPEGDQQ